MRRMTLIRDRNITGEVVWQEILDFQIRREITLAVYWEAKPMEKDLKWKLCPDFQMKTTNQSWPFSRINLMWIVENLTSTKLIRAQIRIHQRRREKDKNCCKNLWDRQQKSHPRKSSFSMMCKILKKALKRVKARYNQYFNPDSLISTLIIVSLFLE